MIPHRIIWHHTADDSLAPQFDKIDEAHKDRGFPKSSLGFYVGYHFLIERDGWIRTARKMSEMGAHDKDENLNSLGIAFAGNFTRHLPTEAQSVSAAKLIASIRKTIPIPITRIEPHRWDDATECPGKFISDSWMIENFLAREGSLAMRTFLQIGKSLNLL